MSLNTTTSLVGRIGNYSQATYHIELTANDFDRSYVVQAAVSIGATVEVVENRQERDDIRRGRIVLKVCFTRTRQMEVDSYLGMVRGLGGSITEG